MHHVAIAPMSEGVGERRVRHRHLQRRGEQIALADGQVHVVADAPRAPVGDAAAGDVPASLATQLFGGHTRAPRTRRHQSGDLAGQVDSSLLAHAELVSLMLDHVAVCVGELAGFEEVGVR